MSDSPHGKILGYECKHVGYSPAAHYEPHDLLSVKEVVYYEDGYTEPHLRLIADYKRPFWITKPYYRNHDQKKEWEVEKHCDRYMATQRDLAPAITRALGRIPTGKERLRIACRSPYVYGADVSSPVLVKHLYMGKWPQYNGEHGSTYRTCMLDTETNVLDGSGRIILSSLALGSKVHLRVERSFLKGINRPEEKIREAFDKYLGEYKAKRHIELAIDLVDTEGLLAYETLQNLHRWQPDWVAIWNISFDIGVIERALKDAGYDPAEAFSDPSVPKGFQYYRFHEGPTQKVTQGGKMMPLPPSDQWHSVIAPASFQFLDAMCVYRKLRIAKGMEPSYSLDSVLERNLGIRKLKFKEADHLVPGSLQWHYFLQKNYPVEYCVYNTFDTISMQELDEKTGDMSRQIGLHSGHSEITKFPSQPRRTWDDIHFECRERGLVDATTSDQMRDDLDSLSPVLTGWICTLPSHNVADEGLKIIEEMPETHTSTFAMVADLDISSTYPTEQVILNISKETTLDEVCEIVGIPDSTRRSVGINLTGGFVNASEICGRLYKAPSFDTLLAAYRASQGVSEAVVEVEAWSDEGEVALEEGEETEEAAL